MQDIIRCLSTDRYCDTLSSRRSQKAFEKTYGRGGTLKIQSSNAMGARGILCLVLFDRSNQKHQNSEQSYLFRIGKIYKIITKNQTVFLLVFLASAICKMAVIRAGLAVF